MGPSSSLTAFVDTLTKREHLALASNTQRRTGLEQLQHLLARLFTSNIATDTKALYQSRKLTAISLEAATYTDNQPKIAPILDMTMPVMELSPITVKSIQDKLNSSGFWGRNAIALSAAPGAIAPPPEITPTILPLPSAPPPEITTTVLENTDFSEQMDTRFAALSTHFDLMQKFLASQNRITTALFSPATKLNYQQYFPFIEQVFEQNEQYLYCQRIFTLASDSFLYDHTLGGKISHLHPEIIALPVIPFAISMEILAEAAVYLGGGNKCVTGIYNIRSYSWLALEAEQLVIDIVAQTQSVTDVDVQLFQVNQDLGDRNLVFTGTVKLSSQFLPAPTLTDFYFENPRMYAWSDEELYKTGMFHGTRFQGVKHIRQVSNNGIEADLEILGIDTFFSHIQEPIFQIDVILIDAAAQLIAYWIAASVGVDFHTFPVQITAFKQYQLLPPGSPVVGRGKMSFTSDRQIEASVIFFDAVGNIIAQIECLQEVFMFVPTKYHKCFTSPINAYLSDSYLQNKTNLVCRCLEEFSLDFLKEMGGIIAVTIAYLVLNKQEREFWYSLP